MTTSDNANDASKAYEAELTEWIKDEKAAIETITFLWG